MFDLLGATVDATTVPAFSFALAVGGIFLILVYLYAASEAGDAIEFKYDTILRERMNQLDILDWQDLGEKAGLSRFGVRLVRQGDVGKLTVDQLRRLATVLNLNFQEFESHFARTANIAYNHNSSQRNRRIEAAVFPAAIRIAAAKSSTNGRFSPRYL